jgi:hypothetical protein
VQFYVARPQEEGLMTTLWQELRYAIRMLRKSPSFTAAAVLTLALAIGANAVVFGALNALILRPLNVPHAQSLYELGRANGDNESYPSYLDLRDRSRSFDDLAAVAFAQAGLDTGEGPSRAWGYKTSGNYFDALGIRRQPTKRPPLKKRSSPAGIARPEEAENKN